MNNNQMVIQEEVNALSIIEGLNLNKVQKSMNAIQMWQKLAQDNLVEGHDYGASFYGASKPSLLKPGAEKILMLLGLSSEYEIIEKIQDYDNGFFTYTIRCILTKNGQVITEGLGHCNSKEKKYESDKQDKFMLGNTCLKMAKKRAQVDAALTVGSLSDIFTQDLEDMVQFTQSEVIETMTIKDAENMKIEFGKYRGKTIKEIYKTDEGYIKWLSEKAKDEAVKKAAVMIMNNGNQASSQTNVDIDTGEIQEKVDESNLPWNTSDEDIPF